MTIHQQQNKTEQQKNTASRGSQVQMGPGQKAVVLSPELQMALDSPLDASPATILRLQRLAGNRAVTGLLQRKVMVGPAHDHYEQEADRVAQQVMSAPVATPLQRIGEDEEEPVQAKPLAASITPLAQRQAVEDEEEVQTKPASSGESFVPDADFETRLNFQQGGGQPLPGDTRQFMENRFGADFSGVRVHADSAAIQLNREVQAQVFTRGSDIFMGEGKYNPQSESGKELLAHELTHTIQQGVLQRALLAKLSAVPAFSDGLDYQTIITTALDKEPALKKVGATWAGGDNKAARKTFKDVCGITDIAAMDAAVTDARLLQLGEVHGNTDYKNKSGDLPAGTTYKEYDTAKYQGDPKLRGSDRIVVGADGKRYYSSNHYKDFAEF